MKLRLTCIALTIAADLTIAAGPATAAGLSLTWTACATHAGARADVAFDCATPGGGHDLFGVFTTPIAGSLVTLDFSIDLQVGAASLPSFWNWAVPPCDEGVFLTVTPPAAAVCSVASPWFVGEPSEASLTFRRVTGASNRGRLVGHRWSADPQTIGENASYFAFQLTFLTALATESGGSCAGCASPAAIVWNSAVMSVSHGTHIEIVSLTGPGVAGNCATANGGTSLCAATPARNRTWGALKSLYR